MEDFKTLIIITGIAVVVSLVIGKYIVNWWYRIDKRVEQNEEIIRQLEFLSGKPRIKKEEVMSKTNATPIDNKPWRCPFCGKENTSDTYVCVKCDYKLK